MSPMCTLYVKELMYNHRASHDPNVYIIWKGTHVQPPGFVWPQCVHYMKRNSCTTTGLRMSPMCTLYVKELMYNHRASYDPNVYIIWKETNVQPPGFVWPQCVHHMKRNSCTTTGLRMSPMCTIYEKELMYNHRASYDPNVYIICKGTHVQPPGFVWPQCVHYM